MTVLVLAALLFAAADGAPRVLAAEAVDVVVRADAPVRWTDPTGGARDVDARGGAALRLEPGAHAFASRAPVLVERADAPEAVALDPAPEPARPAHVTALAVTLAVVLGRCSITFKRRQPKRRPAKRGVAEP